MRSIGWIAALIAGFFVLNSFKKDATTTTTGNDTAFDPHKKGKLNKDAVVQVSTAADGSGTVVSTQTFLKDTSFEIMSLTSNGYYKAITGANQTALFLVGDIVLADAINALGPPIKDVTDASGLIDNIISKPDNTPASGNTPQPSASGQVQLPDDEYTAYNPVKWAKCIRKTAIILNGWNQWIEVGAPVQVYGYKKHYAIISTGALAFTELYDVFYNNQRGFVATATMDINAGSPVVTGNEQSITMQEKYNPPLSGKTNKLTKLYGANNTETTIASGIALQIQGKGIVRTNKFGSWQNLSIYDCIVFGTRGAILVADITLG